MCLTYCLAGGICKEVVAPDTLPTCTCKPGRTGKRCETVIPPPTTVPVPTTTTEIPKGSLCDKLGKDYCTSGTCTQVDGRAKCQCPAAYSGNRCEIASGAGSTSMLFKHFFRNIFLLVLI